MSNTKARPQRGTFYAPRQAAEVAQRLVVLFETGASGHQNHTLVAHSDEPYFRLCFAHADGSQDEFTVTVEHTQHLEPK